MFGKRNKDFVIEKISGCTKPKLGTSSISRPPYIELARVLTGTGKWESIVGWYHTHPKNSLPAFSILDNRIHLMLSFSYSIFSFLSSLKMHQSPMEKLKLSLSISNFEYSQILTLLKAVNGGSSKTSFINGVQSEIESFFLDCYTKSGVDPNTLYNPYQVAPEKFLEIYKNIPKHFSNLEESIQMLLDESKLREKAVSFKIFPIAGLVICTERRDIAVIDCVHNVDLEEYSSDWFYYRVNSY